MEINKYVYPGAYLGHITLIEILQMYL